MEDSSVMEVLGTVFTQFTTWVSSLVSVISSNALLMLGIGIFVVGGVIGLARRLIKS